MAATSREPLKKALRSDAASSTLSVGLSVLNPMLMFATRIKSEFSTTALSASDKPATVDAFVKEHFNETGSP